MFRAQKLTNLQHCFKVTEPGIHYSRRHLGEFSQIKISTNTQIGCTNRSPPIFNEAVGMPPTFLWLRALKSSLSSQPLSGGTHFPVPRRWVTTTFQWPAVGGRREGIVFLATVESYHGFRGLQHFHLSCLWWVPKFGTETFCNKHLPLGWTNLQRKPLSVNAQQESSVEKLQILKSLVHWIISQ